jgi:D-alanyl-D-alanine carboxypeptidase/D-alanyl-D-alanine-endopeptidase (penicillin-binding protein 4)
MIMGSARPGHMGRSDYLSPRRGLVTKLAGRYKRAGLLIAFALLLALPTPAAARTQAAPTLQARLAKALAVPHVNHARSAALAVDLQTGQVVFARNPAMALAPASTEKLALSFALLTALGPAYRIETRVLGDGGLEGTTWRGDLVLKGFGDPSLSSAGLLRLVAQVRKLGIRRVTGSIVGDESFFDARRTAPGWRASFYIWESAPLSALTVDGAHHRGIVSRRPALVAAQLFRSALVSAGVTVAGAATVGTSGSDIELAAVASPPLLHLLRAVNRDSDNFTSEILLKHLGAVQLRRGTTAAGAAAVKRILAAAGVPLARVRVVDGSGLSLLDRLTADALVAILEAAWQDPLLRGSLLASLAVAGENGTLAYRLTRAPARGHVFAKTGTTSLASALAGYVGARYAFAVLQNGPPLASWWCRHAQDRFVTVLASY